METVDGLTSLFEQSAAASSLTQLAAILFAFAARAGFTYAAYVAGVPERSHGADALVLHNYPSAWLVHYGASGAQLDPIFDRARRALRPFHWHAPLVHAEMSPKQLKFIEAAAEFQLGYGYVVPVHAAGCLPVACFFVAPHAEMPAHAHALVERTSIVIHEHACRLTREAAIGQQRAPVLSARERQCLELAALGFGDAAIAVNLGIARTTVRRHMERARTRLDARSRVEAVARALASRQILLL